MGLFGFVCNVASAAIKVAVTPVAIVKDVVDITQGYEPEATANTLGSAIEDVVDSIDELID